MGIFQWRLTKAVEHYRTLQQRDGGWGESQDVGAPTSIVNTVQVLAVMRAAGVGYEDEAIERGISYLKKAVYTHPQPEPERVPGSKSKATVVVEARGERTRYLAWGLSGLTLFKASRHDSELQEAQEHCILWLDANQCRGSAAWGEVPKAELPSLVSTTAAISGLMRVCPNASPVTEQAAELARRARVVVRQLAEDGQARRKPTAFWRLGAENASANGGSPSATAMAVIVLADGDADEKEYAVRGARWLKNRPNSWTTRIEPDGSIPGFGWQHMTFSLALRAIVKATHQPRSEALKRAVRFLDSLWDDAREQWSHGTPGNDPSPSGAYAVVAAYEAIANAWPFEPTVELLGEKATDQERDLSRGETLHIYADRAALVSDVGKSSIEIELGEKPARILELLGRRWIEGSGSKAFDDKSCELGELAAAISVRSATVDRYIREINKEFRDEGRQKRKEVLSVVKVETSSTSLGERAVLRVHKVRLHVD